MFNLIINFTNIQLFKSIMDYKTNIPIPTIRFGEINLIHKFISIIRWWYKIFFNETRGNPT